MNTVSYIWRKIGVLNTEHDMIYYMMDIEVIYAEHNMIYLKIYRSPEYWTWYDKIKFILKEIGVSNTEHDIIYLKQDCSHEILNTKLNLTRLQPENIQMGRKCVILSLSSELSLAYQEKYNPNSQSRNLNLIKRLKKGQNLWFKIFIKLFIL